MFRFCDKTIPFFFPCQKFDTVNSKYSAERIFSLYFLFKIRLNFLISIVTTPWNNIYNIFLHTFTYDVRYCWSRDKIDSVVIKLNTSTAERLHVILRANSIWEHSLQRCWSIRVSYPSNTRFILSIRTI